MYGFVFHVFYTVDFIVFVANGPPALAREVAIHLRLLADDYSVAAGSGRPFAEWDTIARRQFPVRLCFWVAHWSQFLSSRAETLRPRFFLFNSGCRFRCCLGSNSCAEEPGGRSGRI